MGDRTVHGSGAVPATLRRRRKSRGQALVEFTLIAPVMLVLLLLAVDFGRLFFSYIAVNNAAREATYLAATSAGDPSFDLTTFQAAVAAAAARETNVQGQSAAGTVTVSTPVCFHATSKVALDCGTAANFAAGIGNHVSVSASQPFTFLTPIVGELFGGQLTLSASATGPVLNPADITILANPTPSPDPSPTPDPTPTPTPTPTPDPDATPTPTPTPTPPATCTVPDFYHTYFNDIGALTVWHDQRGFTGVLTDDSNGKKIQRQTLLADTVVLCSSSMTVSNN